MVEVNLFDYLYSKDIFLEIDVTKTTFGYRQYGLYPNENKIIKGFD